MKKLNNTYLSQFILNKTDVIENEKYNYLSVNKYLSNVENYLNLIYDWKENTDNINNDEIIENQNIEKLNKEMEKRLENFNKYKLLYKSLSNLQIKNIKKINLKEIIKTESKKLIRQKNKFERNNKNRIKEINKTFKL